MLCVSLHSEDQSVLHLAPLFILVTTIPSGDLASTEPTPERLLGQSLVDAIMANDVVAYSHCWVSTRRMLSIMKQLGVNEISADKLREYHALRNRGIHESFTKIQKLIRDKKIDRKSITLKTCTPSKIRQKAAPKGKLTQTTQFSVLISVGDDEWRFEIDDGLLHDGLWYFSDSPINLFFDNEVLSFRDHRK